MVALADVPLVKLFITGSTAGPGPCARQVLLRGYVELFGVRKGICDHLIRAVIILHVVFLSRDIRRAQWAPVLICLIALSGFHRHQRPVFASLHY